jgi:tetratricopeptide (TPR) repeat protein
MNLAECYRLLGLNSTATHAEIKASYRRLARRYHPDTTAGDARANDQFIAVTTAYKSLLGALTLQSEAMPSRSTAASSGAVPKSWTAPPDLSSQRPQGSPPPATPNPKPVQLRENVKLSPLEQQLKTVSYQQLQTLLRTQRFPRAIALVEGLARRLPRDVEVTQWQAIVYQQWARQLIRDHQPDKARIYLKKAVATDPQNRSLWSEVEKDFRAIEQLFE